MGDASFVEVDDTDNFFVRQLSLRDGEGANCSSGEKGSSNAITYEDGPSSSDKIFETKPFDTKSLKTDEGSHSAPGSLASKNHSGYFSLNVTCGSEITGSSDDITPFSFSRDAKTEGSLKLNISNFASLRQKVTTSFYMIGNLPWRLAAKTECSKRTRNIKFFSVYTDCNPESESTLWNCDAIVEFRLISQKSSIPHFSRQFANKFSFNTNNWGFPSFMEWDEVVNPEKGFVRNDRVVVEAHITIKRVVGVRKSPTFDFTLPHPCVCDGIFVVDGVRLHVSKAYLALYSPVFHAMFFSKFSERDKKEINIEDVILDEFVELLNVVYPSHKPVSGENVEFLLELGDKFEIQFVIDECERFLMRCDDISIATKLLWADQYSLAKLHDVCIRSLKSPLDVKALKTSDEFRSLSDTTKAALLEKILKLL